MKPASSGSKKLYKVSYREIIDQNGVTTVKDLETIETYAVSAQKAKSNARYRIGKPEKEDYLPGDGAYITMYVAKEVKSNAYA